MNDAREVLGVRCRTCGARNTSGAPWCSLCFAEIAAPAEPDAAPMPGPGAEREPAPEPEAAPQPEPASEPEPVVLNPPARRRLPVLSTGARLAVMVVGTLATTAAGFTLLTLLGFLL